MTVCFRPSESQIPAEGKVITWSMGQALGFSDTLPIFKCVSEYV